jgi:hypothetical protein
MSLLPSDLLNEIVRWCHYHYEDNLAGLAFYNPVAIDESFPHGDINLLILLNEAPAEARDRYDARTEVILRNLAPEHKLICRIQTVDEIQTLSQLQLPLVGIYLMEADIVHDPRHVLLEARNACLNYSLA